jgi:hypothetical protein
MVGLEKRETRQISFFVRGLRAGGPVDSSNLITEGSPGALATEINARESQMSGEVAKLASTSFSDI